ncbi:hypothetical protein V6615_13605 [Oscillospiraceae bacterium PP1C4]
MPKIESKYLIYFFVLILILLFYCPYVYATDMTTDIDENIDFDISIDGDKIPGTDIYGNSVTINIVPKSDSRQVSAFINYKGVWMKILSGKDNKFTAFFSGDGNYTYQFRLEDTQTKNSTVKQASFIIDSQLSKLVNEISILPDLYTATDKIVKENEESIVSLKMRYNQLSLNQRQKIPPDSEHRLKALYNWLQNIQPAIDYREPETPVINVTSASDEIRSVYSGSVKIEIVPQNTWNLKSILINVNGNWRELQKDQDNGYSLTLSDQNKYSISVCTQDLNENISESTSIDFMINSVVYYIISETERLYNNAQHWDRDDLVSLENVYLRYLYTSPLYQSYIPADIVSKLENMYIQTMDHYNLSNCAFDQEGNFIKAVGMLSRLDISPELMGTSQITLKADRISKMIIGGAKPAQDTKAQYRISFESASDESDTTSYNIQNNTPVLFCIQVPKDLMGKQNIDLLYNKDGNYISTGAKVRSTKDGLVMFFNSAYVGDFLFISD